MRATGQAYHQTYFTKLTEATIYIEFEETHNRQEFISVIKTLYQSQPLVSPIVSLHQWVRT